MVLALIYLFLTQYSMEAYCVKCKAKREMKDAKEVTMPAKGGGTRPAMKGTCPTCSTGMFRILPKAK
jgi:hypothetical protein